MLVIKVTKDEMVGWHHQLDGREFEQALGVGDGQGGLACCNLWVCKESDMTEQLNWTESYRTPAFLYQFISEVYFSVLLSLIPSSRLFFLFPRLFCLKYLAIKTFWEIWKKKKSFRITKLLNSEHFFSPELFLIFIPVISNEFWLICL